MKSIFATLLLAVCYFSASAQSGNVGPNGPNGTNGAGTDAGRSYSNGAIPNPNEQTQNRPDSTLRNSDTTYMHQQWNDGSSQPNKKDNKRASGNRSGQTASPSKKKK